MEETCTDLTFVSFLEETPFYLTTFQSLHAILPTQETQYFISLLNYDDALQRNFDVYINACLLLRIILLIFVWSLCTLDDFSFFLMFNAIETQVYILLKQINKVENKCNFDFLPITFYQIHSRDVLYYS